MIGIVLVSHGSLAPEALRSIESVLGRSVPGMQAVEAHADDTLEVLRERIGAAVRAVEQGEGTIILTDMYGDSATNVSIALSGQRRIEIVTGTNMPLILKAVSARQTMTLEALAAFLVDYGRDHILRVGSGASAAGAHRKTSGR
jgi:PTS system mannose-specific IIA component